MVFSLELLSDDEVRADPRCSLNNPGKDKEEFICRESEEMPAFRLSPRTVLF